MLCWTEPRWRPTVWSRRAAPSSAALPPWALWRASSTARWVKTFPLPLSAQLSSFSSYSVKKNSFCLLSRIQEITWWPLRKRTTPPTWEPTPTGATRCTDQLSFLPNALCHSAVKPKPGNGINTYSSFYRTKYKLENNFSKTPGMAVRYSIVALTLNLVWAGPGSLMCV